jgi:3-oxoacyl-[acyl-carrier-protein] synthase III
MQLSIPDVRIADVETCDFGLMAAYDTAGLLRAARPADAERLLTSPSSRRMLAELGVENRYLTHVPGRPPAAARLNARHLAHSAVERLKARRAHELARLDAVVFASTSNPNPCNSQAALLACELRLTGSCMDLKAGCSSGLLAIMHGALFIQAGCQRVLVVMAENLSQFTPPDDLRMLCTVGDGAACVLLERAPGPGFLAVIHGTHAALATGMAIREPFPPTTADTNYLYEFADTATTAQFLHDTWRSVRDETLHAAGVASDELACAVFHQTHAAQVRALTSELGLSTARVPMVVDGFGNMGTPTVVVALARVHPALRPGMRYLLQAVGGGVSWCGIVAEHA